MAKDNGFSNLDIEVDSKVVFDFYNINISIPCSIRLLIEDIWNLSRDLNICSCHHVYREANRTTDCLAKKGMRITNSRIWRSFFPKDVKIISVKITVVLLLIIGEQQTS